MHGPKAYELARQHGVGPQVRGRPRSRIWLIIVGALLAVVFIILTFFLPVIFRALGF